ncbi:DUF294 nucleotidyltransferase-like domain-containing protein [Leeia sp. TBRC 13508]|uniref:DUF294 nucleotidyltransferase-like domain-containing protein n=1 Tax=Leeia speluncae TaxID=2884804 RepID=A0ABS8D5W7_9NEIS|nr:DUF294 nucleotidyltransferase-like domain-containing protein [Leeia speluncae]MCB6183577.1 DUF294 nucleotidyltransferase-like domain-containing protein [Leeia speluncae]
MRYLTEDVLAHTLAFLRAHEPFRSMSSAHLELMLDEATIVDYPHDSVLASPALGEKDTFYIVLQGVVLGEQPLAGQEPIEQEPIWWLTDGECFPLGALLLRRPVAGVYRAKSNTRCLEVPGRVFRELMEVSTFFADFCTRRLASLLEASKRTFQAEFAQSVRDQGSMHTSLGHIIRCDPIYCKSEEPIYRVMQTMDEARIGSMIIVDDALHPIGLFTLQDVLSRVAVPQTDPTLPISAVMSSGVITLPAHASVLDATLTMAKFGIRHVLVVEEGRLQGVVSERDLFGLQRTSLRQVGQAIRLAANEDDLRAASKDIRQLTYSMLAQGVSAEHLTQIVSTLNDVLTSRILDLCLRDVIPAGMQYCWLAFGSEGRLEQTLSTDQDNGLVFLPPVGMSNDEARDILLPAAEKVNLMLSAIGFPLCAGNVMASNPACCLSVNEWQTRFAGWVQQASPQELLNATIYFDFRAIYGDRALADQLHESLKDTLADARLFIQELARNAKAFRPPLSFFGEISVPDSGDAAGKIDLKKQGITPFVDVARIFALKTAVEETNTASRLRLAGQEWALDEHIVEAWIDAFHFIQLLRMRLHQQQAARNEPLSNWLAVESLNDLDQRILKESFRQARKLQNLAQKYFQII